MEGSEGEETESMEGGGEGEETGAMEVVEEEQG